MRFANMKTIKKINFLWKIQLFQLSAWFTRKYKRNFREKAKFFFKEKHHLWNLFNRFFLENYKTFRKFPFETSTLKNEFVDKLDNGWDMRKSKYITTCFKLKFEIRQYLPISAINVFFNDNLRMWIRVVTF